MPRALLFSVILFLFHLTACSVNPVTGENQFSLLSPAQEVAMGEQNYTPYQQQQGGRYSVDNDIHGGSDSGLNSDLNRYVNNVGQKLAKYSPNPNLPYEFVILNNETPNAWALPGGKIAINRGLLLMLKDEAQLAAVLSHEIVHAAARHGAQQMTQQSILGLGADLLGSATQGTEYGDLLKIGSGYASNAWQARYGRGQELQSDNYGIDIMVAAGYEPRAAVELQLLFVQLSQGQQTGLLDSLFASHPPSHERVNRNREKTLNLPEGVRNKQAYRRATAQLSHDKAAYKLQQNALKEAQAGNSSNALTLLDDAIKKQPKESAFHISAGQIHLANKNYSKAQAAFTQAKKLNPDYFMSHLGLGLSQKAQNNTTAAKQSLISSMHLLPTQISTYHLGEISLQEGDTNAAIQYFNSAAQSGGVLGKAATAKLQQLHVPTQ
ncbi:MAG: putative Zn-dependent protease [Flavobacteriales bacterium]|jgi:predicted Zn-dependent protease